MEINSPIYCRVCHRSGTWHIDDVASIKSESGGVIWQGFRCSGCGATTIRLTSKSLTVNSLQEVYDGKAIIL